jgi:hypothetical protein
LKYADAQTSKTDAGKANAFCGEDEKCGNLKFA